MIRRDKDYEKIHEFMKDNPVDIRLVDRTPEERRRYNWMAWEIINTVDAIYGDRIPIVVYPIKNDGLLPGTLLYQALRSQTSDVTMKPINVNRRLRSNVIETPLDVIKNSEKSYGILVDDAAMTGGTAMIAHTELQYKLSKCNLTRLDIALDDDKKTGVPDYSIKSGRRRFFDRNAFMRKLMHDDYKKLRDRKLLQPTVRRIGYEVLATEIARSYPTENILIVSEETELGDTLALQKMVIEKKMKGSVKHFRYQNEMSGPNSYKILPNFNTIKGSKEIYKKLVGAEEIILFTDKIKEDDISFQKSQSDLWELFDKIGIESKKRIIATRVDQKALSSFSFISTRSEETRDAEYFTHLIEDLTEKHTAHEV